MNKAPGMQQEEEKRKKEAEQREAVRGMQGVGVQQGSRQPGDNNSKYFHLSLNRHEALNSVLLTINLWPILFRISPIPMVHCKRTTNSGGRAGPHFITP